MTLDLDSLERSLEGITPGVWKMWAMSLMADPVGNSNYEDAVRVATFHQLDADGRLTTRDLSAVQKAMVALPELIRIARAHDESMNRLQQFEEDMLNKHFFLTFCSLMLCVIVLFCITIGLASIGIYLYDHRPGERFVELNTRQFSCTVTHQEYEAEHYVTVCDQWRRK